LEPIQHYENQIQFIVDALKYLNPLTFDVLSYTIIENLASNSKDKLKPDGMNFAPWLSGLATFCGLCYRKYGNMLELSGLLQYLVTSVKSESNSLDLIVLKELVIKMANIDISEDMNDSQLEALAGGHNLKLTTATVPISSSQLKIINRSASKLKEALMNSQLALPLAILIAQSRNYIAFHSDLQHLKMIGDLYDKCQETFIQYIEFISTHIPPRTYSTILPPITQLCQNYYLEPETVFYVCRRALHVIDSHAQITLIANEELSTPLTKESYPSKEFLTQVKSLLPESVWESLSPELYVTFWSLSLYDIYVPKARYESEMQKIRQQQQAEALEKKESAQSNKKKRKREIPCNC